MRLSTRRRNELAQWYARVFGLRSLRVDRARTARPAKSVEQWLRDPKRFDLPGVDKPVGSLKRKRRRGRQRRISKWLPKTRKPRTPKSSTRKRKSEKRPSSYERELANRIWKYMRRHKGYKYTHARALARQIMNLGVDPEEVDVASLDYSLEYGELSASLTRKYKKNTGKLLNPHYIRYMEERLRNYNEPGIVYNAEPEPWQLHYMEEALLAI